MYIIFLYLICINNISYAQTPIDSTLFRYEDTLKVLFNDAFQKDSIKFLKTDKEKTDINEKILNVFQNALEYNNSFNYPFASLKNIGILTSKNKLLKIYTWNLKFKNNEYKYYGFIQYYNKKENEYFLFNLTDYTPNIIAPEQAILNNSKWYGALYYDIIEIKLQGETYYTLLGWKGNNLLTNKKVIEILYISNSGKIIFGKPIIKIENKTKKRIIFEYSIKTVMGLTYNESMNMIIFDHLSPLNSSLKGQYQYYGSDLTYDGLKFEKGVWQFYSNVTMPPIHHKK